MALKVQTWLQIAVTDEWHNGAGTLSQSLSKRAQMLFAGPGDNSVDVCQISKVLGRQNAGDVSSLGANGHGPATGGSDRPGLGVQVLCGWTKAKDRAAAKTSQLIGLACRPGQCQRVEFGRAAPRRNVESLLDFGEVCGGAVGRGGLTEFGLEEPRNIGWPSRLGSGARKALTTKGLGADNGADLIAVDVDVADMELRRDLLHT